MKKIIVIFTLIIVIIAGFIYLSQPKNTGEKEKFIKIYFFRDGKISFVKRSVPEETNLLRYAAIELLKGPGKAEKSKGFFTQIPQQTKLLRIQKRDAVAFADFSKDLEKYGGGTAKVQGILAQIVYTLTGLENISSVQILVGGKKEAALGSEGYIIDKPLKRKDVGNY